MRPQSCSFYKTKENTGSVGFKYLHFALVAKVSGYGRDNAASYNDVMYLNCGADFINAEISG
jgi:hypothetical protein